MVICILLIVLWVLCTVALGKFFFYVFDLPPVFFFRNQLSMAMLWARTCNSWVGCVQCTCRRIYFWSLIMNIEEFKNKEA